jgi:hypothetical protein
VAISLAKLATIGVLVGGGLRRGSLVREQQSWHSWKGFTWHSIAVVLDFVKPAIAFRYFFWRALRAEPLLLREMWPVYLKAILGMWQF